MGNDSAIVLYETATWVPTGCGRVGRVDGIGQLRTAEDRAGVVDAIKPRCDESEGRAWKMRLTWAKYLLSKAPGYNKGPSRGGPLEYNGCIH